MGLLDKIKSMVGGNADKVEHGIDKAGDMIDEKTGGEFTDKIDMAEEKVEEKMGEFLEDQAEDEV